MFLLDHCVWKETENTLRKAGWECVTLKELKQAEADNGKVIAIAKSHKATLLTRDRDFSNLALYPLGTHTGIIVLRITPESMDKVHEVLLGALRSIPPEQLKGNLLIVTGTTYHLHKHKS